MFGKPLVAHLSLWIIEKTEIKAVDEQQQGSALDDAPEHVQLAVDLIMLLESNNIEPSLALEALELVKADLQNKIA